MLCACCTHGQCQTNAAFCALLLIRQVQWNTSIVTVMVCSSPGCCRAALNPGDLWHAETFMYPIQMHRQSQASRVRTRS